MPTEQVVKEQWVVCWCRGHEDFGFKLFDDEVSARTMARDAACLNPEVLYRVSRVVSGYKMPRATLIVYEYSKS